MEMEEFQELQFRCPHCSQPVVKGSQFCVYCGTKMPPEISGKEEEKKVSGDGLWLPVILFFSLISLTAYLRFSHQAATPDFMLGMYVVFCSFILIAAALAWKDIKPALRVEKINWNMLGIVIAGPILMGFLFHYMVKFINNGLYNSTVDIYMFEDTSYPILFSFLGICLQPAIFEELAYRGIIFGRLKNYMDEGSIVIVTGMLFALSHLSPVGMIWLLPLGLVLGALRKYTKCIWYGVIFHMLYNFSAILLSAHERGMMNF
jgi:uncharacterized protein